MFMDIQKQLKTTVFITPKKFCFNNLVQKSISESEIVLQYYFCILLYLAIWKRMAYTCACPRSISRAFVSSVQCFMISVRSPSIRGLAEGHNRTALQLCYVICSPLKPLSAVIDFCRLFCRLFLCTGLRKVRDVCGESA